MSETEKITGEALLELIPQRLPMVMVDSFYGIREGVTYTGLQVREENLFCEEGCLQEYGIVEHMAQSAAVRAGWLCRQAGKRVPLGFIGSVEDLWIDRLPGVGTMLRTEVRVLQEIFGITLIEARVNYEGQEGGARGKMKIVIKQEEV